MTETLRAPFPLLAAGAVLYVVTVAVSVAMMPGDLQHQLAELGIVGPRPRGRGHRRAPVVPGAGCAASREAPAGGDDGGGNPCPGPARRIGDRAHGLPRRDRVGRLRPAPLAL